MNDEDTPVRRTVARPCAAHGEYEAIGTSYPVGSFLHSSEHFSRCPACVAEAEEAERTREQRERRDRIRQLKYGSGVPARFARADFDGYQVTTDRMQVNRDLLADFAARWKAKAASGQSLLLVGGPGTGKTHLACAVCNGLADQLKASRYGTAADLVGEIKRGYGQRGGDNVGALIDEMRSAPLLVIDELDVGLSEHDVGLLFRIIDGRYADLQPMVLISNRPVDQLEQQLGQRVMDRLRECALTVAFDWPSHRGTARTGRQG